jgi:hypothetical protein
VVCLGDFSLQSNEIGVVDIELSKLSGEGDSDVDSEVDPDVDSEGQNRRRIHQNPESI